MKVTRHLTSVFLVLTAALSSILFSCMEDPGTHFSQFIYPNSNSNPFYYGYMPIYADTPYDSIFFATTEQWQLKTEYFGGSEDWLTIDSDILTPFFKIQESTVYYMSGPVAFEPNTTGHKRFARISLGAGKYDCSGGFIQLPYLCITRPLRYVVTSSLQSSLESRDSLASLVSMYNTPGDSIVFNVHSDWVIVGCSDAWVHPVVNSGKAGMQTVYVNYDTNTSGVERRDTLFIKTKGQNNTTDKFIIDTIPFVQRAIS